MRGADQRSGSLFSYVDIETRVPKGHPLRAIREIVNVALSDLNAEFAELYTALGRPSIAPEKLLRALLLQAFYTVRSERQLMERLEFDLLFRWFVGLGIDDTVWDHSVFSKNRDRLLEGDIATTFLAANTQTTRDQAPVVERALLGGRHPGGSLGEPEELQAEDRRRR
jgi:transposase